jgi:nucleotide-binding universal stress UspA family protein
VAVALAQNLKAKLTVLVVAGDRARASEAQKLMEQVHALVANLTPRPEIVPLVGYADEVLLQRLAKHPTDLYVMAAFQDRGAGSSTAIGPTAQRVVQHAPTSVWMVKGHRTVLRRILACVAVDDTVVVDVAAQLARATGAALSVLHVVPPSAASYLSSQAGEESLPSALALDEVMAQGTHLSTLLHGWSTQLEKQGVSQDALILERGTVPEAVLRVAHDGNFDLIVVGSQSGPGHFLGSVANGVARYAEQSVLIVRTRSS